MLKFFRTAFGLSGDRTAIPDAADVNGNVSYAQGYGYDYQRQKTDPTAKKIERDKMNSIFFDITNAIAELQAQGIPDFITSALNGGTAYSYGQNAVVRYSGDLYLSLVAANTALPSDATKWALLPNPARLQNALNTRATAAGTVDAITATFTPALTAYPAAPGTISVLVRAGGANTSATPTFAPDGLAAKAIVKGANQTLVAGDIAGAGHWLHLDYDPTLDKWVLLNPAKGINVVSQSVVAGVRQTVLAGPVDANGLPSFGGATGGTTVTATGTLTAAAANGFGAKGAVDRIGQITNPSWTGLSINGAMYLYLDIAADGTCTPGSTNLAPVYQRGGTYSTVNNQNTFNIQEMTMTVGNGSTASQVYRVFVGEVAVSGGVVSGIAWYALMGRYVSQFTACSTGLVTNSNDNLGVQQKNVKFFARCKTAEFGYAVGDLLQDHLNHNISGAYGVVPVADGRNTTKTIISGSFFAAVPDKSTGAVSSLTAANWEQAVNVERGW